MDDNTGVFLLLPAWVTMGDGLSLGMDLLLLWPPDLSRDLFDWIDCWSFRRFIMSVTASWLGCFAPIKTPCMCEEL